MTLFERMRALPEDCRAALRRASAWAVLAALLDAACGVLLVPLVEAWFAEGALPWRWVAALLGLSLAQALLQYLALRRGFAAGGSLAAGLVRSLVARLPRLAPPALRRVAPAEGLLRGPVMQAMGIPAHLLGPLIAAMVTPLGVILGLFLIDPSIALGLLVAGAVLAALLRWSGRRNLAAEDARLAAERDAARQLQAFAERQPLLRAAQRESVARQGLEEALRSLHRSTLELLRRSLPSGLGFALAVQAAFAFALLGGAWAVERQWLDGARLVAVLVLLVRFIEPLAQLTHLDQALRGAWQALDTLLRVFALAPLHSPEPGERPHDASLAAEAVELRLEDGRALPVPGSRAALDGAVAAARRAHRQPRRRQRGAGAAQPARVARPAHPAGSDPPPGAGASGRPGTAAGGGAPVPQRTSRRSARPGRLVCRFRRAGGRGKFRDGRGSIEKDRQSKKPRRRFLHNDKHYQIVYPPRLFER